MACHVCPWWMGYLLASPLRRLMEDPKKLLAPYVSEGTTVLEPGPGMGFFTLDLARLVGPKGRVIAVELQPKMIAVLNRKAHKAGLSERIFSREPKGDSMAVSEFNGQVDLVLAYAVVHELPNMVLFFQEASAALKPGGKLLLAEPAGHVKKDAWEMTLRAANDAGLNMESTPAIRRSRTALLIKR